MATKHLSLVRVRVTDDHHNGAESLRVLLEQMGCDVRLAYGGSDAIAATPSFRPQLVISDINMPGLNGYEMVRRLKEQPWADSAVFVAHSAIPPGIGYSKTRPRSFFASSRSPGAPSDFEAVLSEVRAAGFSIANG